MLAVGCGAMLGEGVVGQTAKSGLPRMIILPSADGKDLDREAAESMRQVICLPLIGRRGMLGVLCAASDHAQPLDELETQFLAHPQRPLRLARNADPYADPDRAGRARLSPNCSACQVCRIERTAQLPVC